ncbi:hypothetical protein [Pseudobacter ginsenosidimutans]|uniref:hypothetical protein n=1 Tax=Pseudobacter ginsenosidimutans TaxID=661488 RepID=UPI00102DF635|nr:hypothetical protein [Pseudobacter ginsenosidimutans]QEC41786.1 hypothetical protein FSB84_08795 [Pseudobacter ginsenosidimutans]
MIKIRWEGSISGLQNGMNLFDVAKKKNGMMYERKKTEMHFKNDIRNRKMKKEFLIEKMRGKMIKNEVRKRRKSEVIF